MTDTLRPPLPQWSGVSRLPGLEGRIPVARRGAVVLATAGSLGDLYPVLSVARSLEDLGVETRLLLSPDDCEIARSWGLLATSLGPSRAELCAMLGQSEDAIAAAFLRDPLPFLRRVAIPMTAELMPEIDLACRGAACVSGTLLAFGAAFGAERAGLPFVPLLLQPLMQASRLDPPRSRGFDLMRPAPATALGRGWNALVLGAIRGTLGLALRGPMNRLRRDLGLPPLAGTPLLDPGAADVPLRLGLWSDRFAPRPADAPRELRPVGFPRSPLGHLPPDVSAWLAEGPPPLVVTLGSIAQGLAGDGFYDRAVALARAMGLRAVVLHGQAAPPAPSPDVLARPALPHAPLFPEAAAVLHHGGIGTTAETLRAGRPHLVVPIGGDQPDNAARLERLGLAVTLTPKRFTPERALPPLRRLLECFDYAAAAELATHLTAEDGAEAAARNLAQIASIAR
ncbi:nucleotide disphospho-sugar-binding domain-containing protein [Jannaschia marina]|uniref:nucleotide disphospho-sugar-binding domain-containing protein n=1 Tax=Jannaschia marina TaxID=2741674 RepID=UPI0015CB562A|nr:glycosyltransferase [Jannaschia marina]